MKNLKNKLDTGLKSPKQTYFWLAIILLATAFIWSFFWRTPGLQSCIKTIRSAFSYLDPAQGIYDKKDLIVNVQPLRDELNVIGNNKKISIYFEYLNTGASIAVNKDLDLWPGSLMKIPVAMAVMKKVDEGNWKLSNELVLFNEDKDPRFGELYKQPVGTKFTIENLLDEMLINSDNTARTIFVRNLENQDIDAVLEHLSIEDIFSEDYAVSAKKYSVFWRSLYTTSFLSPESSQKLLDIMTKTPFDAYIAGGLPKNIKFAHKIGLYTGKVYSDSGIIYLSNRPYILTVMMEESDQSKAEAQMKDISERVYKYVSSY